MATRQAMVAEVDRLLPLAWNLAGTNRRHRKRVRREISTGFDIATVLLIIQAIMIAIELYKKFKDRSPSGATAASAALDASDLLDRAINEGTGGDE